MAVALTGLSAALLQAGAAFAPVPAQAAATLSVTRLAGADRYLTGAAVAGSYPSSPRAVYVATGLSFPDALSAGPAAGTDAPILLTPGGGAVPTAVVDQVARLRPDQVILVGGPGVLPDSVGATLGRYAVNGWTRYYGNDRSATSAAVSAHTFAAGVPIAFVATGLAFPDALTGAALGARLRGPVLLTGPTTLPTSVQQELARLKPARIVVLGGPGAVSDGVLNALKSYSGDVTRVWGSDRYATNRNALGLLSSAASVVVATGANFPDALTGSALAAHLAGALLLSASDGLTPEQRDTVAALAPTAVTAVGGTGALPDLVLTQLRYRLDPASFGTDSASQAAGADFAASRWGDPWDYANGADLLLDPNGPTSGVSKASMSGGAARFTVSGAGYVSPLWGGYTGALHLGREGAAPGNGIPAGTFRRLALQVYSSIAQPAGVMWFTCAGGGVSSSCGGGQPFSLRAGWQTVVLDLGASRYSGWPVAWGGTVNGLRLAFSPGSGRSASVALDWVRLVQPGSGATLAWTNPVPGQTASLVWDSDSSRTNNSASQSGWGVLATTTAASATADLSVLPPGSYTFYAQAAGATSATHPPVLLQRPQPQVTAPDALGNVDAAAAAGNPWDMSSAADVSSIGNARLISYAGGQLSATNTSNDPFVWLRLPSGGISSSVYNQLTFTLRYDGAFNLANRPGGGTMARVVWRRADLGSAIMQTQDIVTYHDVATYTVDMSQPGLNETSAPNQYPFVGGTVTGLRIDPNEDPGARRWHLADVTLRSRWQANASFVVRWQDTSWRPATTVAVLADTDRSGCNGPVVASGIDEQPGQNAAVVNTSGLAAGRYWMCVQATHNGAVSAGYAPGLLVVAH